MMATPKVLDKARSSSVNRYWFDSGALDMSDTISDNRDDGALAFPLDCGLGQLAALQESTISGFMIMDSDP